MNSSPAMILVRPSWQHLFGTTALGDDVLARLMSGALGTFGVALSAAVLSVTIGGGLGTASALAYRTRVDWFIMRFTEALQSLPQFLLVGAMVILFQKIHISEIAAMICGIAAFEWVVFFRYVRILVLDLKQEEYMESARALGCSRFRILTSHVLRNILPELSTYFIYVIPQFILLEAFLSFVGVGFSDGTSSWGTQIQEGWKYLSVQPGLFLAPALALVFSNLIIQILFRKKRY